MEKKTLKTQAIIWTLSLAVWGMQCQAESEKPASVETKQPTTDLAKGEFPILPGQSINESLSASDGQFDDNTYYDQYNLNWPGGNLTITMDSSQFDEYLVVFEPPGYPNGTRVDVDSQTGTPAEVYQKSDAPAGNYTIWANSFEPSFGDYSMSVSQGSATPTPTPSPTQCPNPNPPSAPSPAHESQGIPTDVNLAWDAKMNPKVIYGPDDRIEVYEIQNPSLAAAADATVVMVGLSLIQDNGNGTFTLDDQSFTDYVAGSEGAPLCPEEPFRLQPVPGSCSGVLVGEDLIATAGHCIENQTECGSNAFIFGFDMIDANTPRLTVDSSEVYYCSEIVGRMFSNTGADWAIIRLDRPVVGHTPLPIRRTGKIADNQGLIIIGHPVGLPKKIAGNANVRSNDAASFFVGNLDSYSGNSGSPVLNAQTLEVEGLLVRGNNDFQPNGNCTESVICSDSGCRGEDVNRTTEFDHLVPELPSNTYTVLFGECGSLNELGTTDQTTWDLPILDPGKTYCWQVQVKNFCGGMVTGPLWSFTTEGDIPTPTETPTATQSQGTPVPTALDPRADINLDGRIDTDDMLLILENWYRRVE